MYASMYTDLWFCLPNSTWLWVRKSGDELCGYMGGLMKCDYEDAAVRIALQDTSFVRMFIRLAYDHTHEFIYAYVRVLPRRHFFVNLPQRFIATPHLKIQFLFYFF